VAQVAVRAAVAEAARRLPGLPLFAGGKSFGGRMTSQRRRKRSCPACAASFSRLPLHRLASRRTSARAPGAGEGADVVPARLARDFAQISLLQPLVRRSRRHATLKLFDDPTLVSPAGALPEGRRPLRELLDSLAAWVLAALEPRLRATPGVPVITRHPDPGTGKARCKIPCLQTILTTGGRGRRAAATAGELEQIWGPGKPSRRSADDRGGERRAAIEIPRLHRHLQRQLTSCGVPMEKIIGPRCNAWTRRRGPRSELLAGTETRAK